MNLIIPVVVKNAASLAVGFASGMVLTTAAIMHFEKEEYDSKVSMYKSLFDDINNNNMKGGDR